MAQNHEVKAKQFVNEAGILDGSGSMGIITGNDSTFEANVGSWVAYSDSPGTVPVDGTGGSPTISIERTTTSPLRGTGSLLITKPALIGLGQGASVERTVDPVFRGKPLKLSFAYEGSANFSYASQASDVQAFLYDVTNSRLLQPNPIFLDGSGYYAGSIQLPTNCASIRVILHIATVSALAWTLEVDDVQLELNANEFVNSDSDWVAYTPTFTGLGTVSSVSVFWRRNGANIEIQGKFTLGTTTAVEARMSLPTGLTSISTLSGTNVCGVAARSVTSANAYYTLIEPSVTYLTFGLQGGANAGLTKQNGDGVGVSTNTIALTAIVPIQGLTSGYAHPAAIGLNAQVVMRAFKNGGSITGNTTIASWTTVDKDTTGSFNSTTGIYTVRTPGDYLVNVLIQSTTQTSDAPRILLNGTSYLLGTTDANSSLDSATAVLVNLKYGDQITVQMTGNVTLASSNNSQLAIVKLGSEAQPYAPRIAYVKDLKASGTAGGTATSGSYQTRVLNTIEGDASFISLASNQFTLQPGTYHIEASAPANGSANTVVQNKIKCRNITDSTDAVIGQIALSVAPPGVTASTTNALLMGTFSISAAKTFEIQHRVTTTNAGSGFGGATSFGDSEIYTQVKITKVL